MLTKEIRRKENLNKVHLPQETTRTKLYHKEPWKRYSTVIYTSLVSHKTDPEFHSFDIAMNNHTTIMGLNFIQPAATTNFLKMEARAEGLQVTNCRAPPARFHHEQ